MEWEVCTILDFDLILFKLKLIIFEKPVTKRPKDNRTVLYRALDEIIEVTTRNG